VFPNRKSAIRLIAMVLIEQTEDWITERNYMSEESMQLAIRNGLHCERVKQLGVDSKYTREWARPRPAGPIFRVPPRGRRHSLGHFTGCTPTGARTAVLIKYQIQFDE
jgi:hypothetical protein